MWNEWAFVNIIYLVNWHLVKGKMLRIKRK